MSERISNLTPDQLDVATKVGEARRTIRSDSDRLLGSRWGFDRLFGRVMARIDDRSAESLLRELDLPVTVGQAESLAAAQAVNSGNPADAASA